MAGQTIHGLFLTSQALNVQSKSESDIPQDIFASKSADKGAMRTASAHRLYKEKSNNQ
jgi:hypothetical protein